MILLPLGPCTSGGRLILFFRLYDFRQAVDLHILHFLPAPIRPDDRPTAGAAALSQPNRHRQFHLRKIAPRGHYLPANRLPVHFSFNPCPDGVAIARAANELETKIVMAKLLVVAKEDRRGPVLHQNYVQIAVVVYVGIRRPASDDGREQIRPAFLRRERNKLAAKSRAGVPKQERGLFIGLR